MRERPLGTGSSRTVSRAVVGGELAHAVLRVHEEPGSGAWVREVEDAERGEGQVGELLLLRLLLLLQLLLLPQPSLGGAVWLDGQV